MRLGKNAQEPREMKQRCGDAYISNPGAFEHQVAHRDVEEPLGSEPPLLDFGSWGPCKVAVQFRCHVFSENRGTKPAAKPIAAFQAASAVVARWLVETSLRLPGKADCEACLRCRDGSS